MVGVDRRVDIADTDHRLFDPFGAIEQGPTEISDLTAVSRPAENGLTKLGLQCAETP
jgi:hypothetical protein